MHLAGISDQLPYNFEPRLPLSREIDSKLHDHQENKPDLHMLIDNSLPVSRASKPPPAKRSPIGYRVHFAALEGIKLTFKNSLGET